MGPTYGDVRDVMTEGESGLLACTPPEYTENGKRWNRSLGELTLTNGTIYKLYSSEKPDRLRGPQHSRSWCDEIGSWENGRETFDMLQMGLRLGKTPQNVITTTPKPVKMIRELVASPHTFVARGSTYDNKKNLPPTFLQTILAKYEGTRLGRQELYAELLEDYEGALWSRKWIDDQRIMDETPEEVAAHCSRIVVAIDPSVTSGEDSDETGVVAVGIDGDEGYVLADVSCRVSPREWAAIAIKLLKRFGGDRIIAETNNGGDLVEETIRMVDPNVPFRKVTASRGKYVRAEPISALYEQGRIHHVGGFEELEDQMCIFTPDNIARNSPDRVDALVWGATELFSGSMTLGALKLFKEESAARLQDRIMGKIAVSSLTKPVVAKQTTGCPVCESKAVVQVAGRSQCNQCGHQFGDLPWEIQSPSKRSDKGVSWIKA